MELRIVMEHGVRDRDVSTVISPQRLILKKWTMGTVKSLIQDTPNPKDLTILVSSWSCFTQSIEAGR